MPVVEQMCVVGRTIASGNIVQRYHVCECPQVEVQESSTSWDATTNHHVCSSCCIEWYNINSM